MTDRLYGIPGAEEFDDELTGAYESNEADYAPSIDLVCAKCGGSASIPLGLTCSDHDLQPFPGESFKIEEWSATSLADYVARRASDDTLHILEHLHDQYCEDVGMENACDHIERAANDDDVRAAFVSALKLFASKCTGYLIADKLLHTYTITWDADGEPLADGMPIYRPREDGCGR